MIGGEMRGDNSIRELEEVSLSDDRRHCLCCSLGVSLVSSSCLCRPWEASAPWVKPSVRALLWPCRPAMPWGLVVDHR